MTNIDKKINIENVMTINGQSDNSNTYDLKGKWTLLFFIPKIDTSVCSSEVQILNSKRELFNKDSINIIVGSVDSKEVLTNEAKKFNLNLDFVYDNNSILFKKLNILNDKNETGRLTLLIDPELNVKYILMNSLLVARSIGNILDDILAIKKQSESEKPLSCNLRR